MKSGIRCIGSEGGLISCGKKLSSLINWLPFCVIPGSIIVLYLLDIDTSRCKLSSMYHPVTQIYSHPRIREKSHQAIQPKFQVGIRIESHPGIRTQYHQGNGTDLHLKIRKESHQELQTESHQKIRTERGF